MLFDPELIGTKDTTDMTWVLIIGLVSWAIVLWLFVDKLKRYNTNGIYAVSHNNNPPNNVGLKNSSITLIAFHVSMLLLTVLKVFKVDIPYHPLCLSWLIIGTAVASTFLNVAMVGGDLFTNLLTKEEKDKSIASLVLQCFSNSLMFAVVVGLI